MKRTHRVTHLVGLSALLAGGLTFHAGCAEPSLGPGAEDPGLKIDVAPLSLPGIVEATYTLTVKNGLAETVWSAGPLASTQYGNGQGALTYIGPCDASENPHSVELVLNGLTSATGALSSPADYVNPTIDASGTVTPITLSGIECVENGDVLVAFDLTILRSAKQGFFDFAINFDDIFCSAKLDCREALLHDEEGARGPTVVFAFACTGGDGDPTHLYLSDLSLACTGSGGTTTIPVSAATVGQQGELAPAIYQWAVYQGQEFLSSDYDKCFWNMALGLDTTALAGQTCTLSAIGTASQTPLVPNGTGGYQIPQGGAYPIITWDVQVLSATGELCTNNALNAASSGVQTDYVTADTVLSALPTLAGSMHCGGPEAASCSVDTGAGSVATTPTEGGFRLSLGAEGPSATIALPPGYVVSGQCCTPGCCQ